MEGVVGVLFVDFNWAGPEFVSVDPPHINYVTSVWSEGVADGEPMLQSFDVDFLSIRTR